MTQYIDRQLVALKARILEVGAVVEASIANAVSALINQDPLAAQKVIDHDHVIDRMEVEFEEDCLKILALYQPVANDLRFVVAALKINNDLERMGDLAKNIAKRVKFIATSPRLDLPADFRHMATDVQQMVKKSLDSLVNADADLARQVRADDDHVDEMRQRIRYHVLHAIRRDPENTEYWLKLNSVSKHLERVADMATSVAEDVIYMVEGSIVRHQSE